MANTSRLFPGLAAAALALAATTTLTTVTADQASAQGRGPRASKPIKAKVVASRPAPAPTQPDHSSKPASTKPVLAHSKEAAPIGNAESPGGNPPRRAIGFHAGIFTPPAPSADGSRNSIGFTSQRIGGARKTISLEKAKAIVFLRASAGIIQLKPDNPTPLILPPGVRRSEPAPAPAAPPARTVVKGFGR